MKHVLDFINIGIWRVRIKDMSKSRSFFIRHLRIFLLAFQGFDEDKCQLRASSLTFYSLLSIVPIVAMAFGVAKGFGFERMLEDQLMQNIPAQEEMMKNVIVFAKSMLDSTRGGLIAGIGVAMLFWLVIQVLGNVETSFNDIWGVKKTRPIERKIADYLSVMVFAPILFIISSGAMVFLTTQVELIISKIAILGFLSPVLFLMVKLLPYILIWILFSFIYVFMPNTHVNISSGIFGGIIAGTIYVITQWAYITFQIGVARYNAIYGSFAALPLFLGWLQISWLIVLFGAEISFANQNVDTYEFEPDCLRASPYFKSLLSLYIMHFIVKSLMSPESPKTPCTSQRISHELDIPIRLVRDILYTLVECGLLTRTTEDEDKGRGAWYHPAYAPEFYTTRSVLAKIEHYGSEDIPVTKTPELEKLRGLLEGFWGSVSSPLSPGLLKDV